MCRCLSLLFEALTHLARRSCDFFAAGHVGCKFKFKFMIYPGLFTHFRFFLLLIVYVLIQVHALEEDMSNAFELCSTVCSRKLVQILVQNSMFLAFLKFILRTSIFPVTVNCDMHLQCTS